MTIMEVLNFITIAIVLKQQIMVQVLGIDLGTTNSDMAIIGFKILTIVMVSKRQLMVQFF